MKLFLESLVIFFGTLMAAGLVALGVGPGGVSKLARLSSLPSSAPARVPQRPPTYQRNPGPEPLQAQARVAAGTGEGR